MSFRSAVFIAVFLFLPFPSGADVLHLRSGGKVEGKVLNPDEHPRQNYIIQTDAGVRLTLAAEHVKHMVLQAADEEEYDRLRRTAPDTAEGHWQLAEWCTERRMLRQREHHLEKVIEHDPQHAEARRLLGYQLVDGQWLTREQIMQSRGYEYFEGSWRTPQDIALREAKKAREEAELKWKLDLRRWRAALTGKDADRAAEAQRQILAASDVHAAPALVDLLESERLPQVRRLFIDALAGNPSGTATAALMELAIKEPDRELRTRASDAVLERKHPDMVRQLAKALKSNDNVEVNRAAVLLGELGYESAISPLIEALVTKHRFKMGSGRPQVAAGFSPGRGGGLNFGGGGSKVVEQSVENHDVLSALVKLAGGQSFEFNAVAWRRWYANTLRVEAVNMRRD